MISTDIAVHLDTGTLTRPPRRPVVNAAPSYVSVSSAFPRLPFVRTAFFWNLYSGLLGLLSTWPAYQRQNKLVLMTGRQAVPPGPMNAQQARLHASLLNRLGSYTFVWLHTSRLIQHSTCCLQLHAPEQRAQTAGMHLVHCCMWHLRNFLMYSSAIHMCLANNPATDHLWRDSA